MRKRQAVPVPYHELAAALIPLWGRTDLTTAEVLDAVLTAYNAVTGEHLAGEALDAEGRDRVGRFLRDAENGDAGRSLLWHKPALLGHLPLYPDTASKFGFLYQKPCAACPGGDEFPTRVFPIGVPPWSHQCAAEVGPALRKAIEGSPRHAQHFRAQTAHGPVCMRVVFVLGDGATMKDCDNMAKGLLDAFQGLLYVNDRQVEHLDLIKMHDHPGAGVGYILIRVASSAINRTDDVLIPKHAELLWMNDLGVERFLPKPQ
jgi:hypothetical protein